MTRLGFLERKLHDEREKALDAARAAVVEAAKAWRSEPSMSTKFGLMNALDALEKLERPDA